jgi:hypothetical protein
MSSRDFDENNAGLNQIHNSKKTVSHKYPFEAFYDDSVQDTQSKDILVRHHQTMPIGLDEGESDILTPYENTGSNSKKFFK